MIFSKYNYTYFSKKHNKTFLYNSLTNVMIELSESLIKIINSYKNNLQFNDSKLHKEFIEAKILVESDEIEFFKLKQRIQQRRYNNNTISLTLIPTLSCNFECPYCFVKSDKNSMMKNETINGILKFIKRISSNNINTTINISWMGGEPLLNFDIIEKISKKIKNNSFKINANLVTNGYLLNEEIVKKLKLNDINHIQITIDGLREEHNLTRIHKSDEDSFSKIIQNLDNLLTHSDHEILTVNIRVNLLKESDYIKKFNEISSFLRNRYPNKNLFISPGFIENIKDNFLNSQCEFCKSDIKDFLISMSQNPVTRYNLYPQNFTNECAIRSQYCFVIGPDGELYSCWDNLGYEDKIIGSITKNGYLNIINETIYYRSHYGADIFDDDNCKDCFFLPICSGGCPEKRIRNYYENAKFELCTIHKDYLEEILDDHYEKKN